MAEFQHTPLVFSSFPRKCEYYEMHKYFIPPLLNLKKRRKLIRGHIAAYLCVSVSRVESKDGFILMKPLCAHCSISAVLFSRLLKLHNSGDARDSAVTSCGFALRLITAEVQGSWIISCQKVLELQQNELCVQIRLCGFYCFPPRTLKLRQSRNQAICQRLERGTDYKGRGVGLVTPKTHSSLGRSCCPTSMHRKES